MARWFNSTVGGVRKESSHYETDVDAIEALRHAMQLHAARGHDVEGDWHGMRWVVVDADGTEVATYWFSDHDEGAVGDV
jgi:hypothetical protein